jgi:hypothetical protein
LNVFLTFSGSPRAEGLHEAPAQELYPGSLISFGGFISRGFIMKRIAFSPVGLHSGNFSEKGKEHMKQLHCHYSRTDPFMMGAGCSTFYGYSPAQVNLLFTHCSILAGGDGGPLNHFAQYTNGSLVVNATNSEFDSGSLCGYGLSGNFMNCLMDRVNAGQSDWFDGCAWGMTNCTWHGGSLTLTNNEYIVQDSAFDGTLINVPDNPGDPALYPICWFNAFGNGAQAFPMSGGSNVLVTNGFNWQSSVLGNYYLPSDSPLIAAGYSTSDQLGLSAFTTQTNQVAEGTAIVDIGYHYLACAQASIPVAPTYITTGLVAYWKMNDGTGNWASNSISAYPLFLTGSPP